MERTITRIARDLNLRSQATHLPHLVFVTDERRSPDPKKYISQLPPGSGVLFRHYNYHKRNELALSLRSICDDLSLTLIIADDLQLAIDVKADGLHLPEYRLKSPSKVVFKWRRTNNVFLTAAAHSSRTTLKALRLNLDAVFLSPIFQSSSHPEVRPLGLMRFMKICTTVNIPIYALGGINDISAKKLTGCGAVGIAAIGALIGPVENKG